MKKYKEFYEDLILESIVQFPIQLSDSFYQIMYDISNKYLKEISDIADVYLNIQEADISHNVNFINTSDDNKHAMIYNCKNIISKYELDQDLNQIFLNEKGSTISIGKLTRKILSIKYGNIDKFSEKQIENFVNAYKAEYDILEYDRMNKSIEIVSGDQIPYWYNESKYESDNGSLGNSCMRHEECLDFLDIYNKSGAQLIILKNGSNKLLGRAILWKLNSGKYFMDRIYTNYDSDINLFINFAKNNGFMYKYVQNYRPDEYLMIPDDNYKDKHYVDLEVDTYKANKGDKDKFPYMDTMRYYYWEEGILTNYVIEKSYFVKLTSTEGDCYCDRCDQEGVVYCNKCYGEGCNVCSNTGHIDCNSCGNFYGVA